MHRFILPVTDSDLVVDHKDGNGLNNRRDNLQRITQSQNQQRQHIGYSNESGYKGVAWQKSRKRWYASIMHNGKSINLGRYTNVLDAARAYDKAAIELFGKFANINFA